jgi:hypothetical protein
VLQQIVNLADHLARERLLGVRARNFQRGSGHANPDSQRRLDGADVRVVLAEQIREQARIVEVEFERIFGS